jgi:hypothetical protein
MTQYIALITDSTGRYATVSVSANTWNNAVYQLEDAGCEVIENQSEDYEGCFPEELREADVIPINELTSSSDFVEHN